MTTQQVTYADSLVYNGDLDSERLSVETGETSRDLLDQEIDQIMNIFDLDDISFDDEDHISSLRDQINNLEISGVDTNFIINTARWSQQIVDIVDKEKKMLHPGRNAVMRSYLEGNASFYLKEDGDHLEAIGYCRFIPVMDQDKAHLLGLREDFPEIYELGTVIVDQSKRESGTGSRTVRAVHRINGEDIREGNRLIIGTTTTHLMMGVLRKMATPTDNYNGTTYTRMSHVSEGVEFIGATTCVCEPGDIAGPKPGETSRGMHFGQDACEVRTTDIGVYTLTPDQKRFEFNQGRCMMFVSDENLARQMNTEIRGVTQNNGMTIEDFSRFLMEENPSEAQRIIADCRINLQNP